MTKPKELTFKEIRFIDEYMLDLNPKNAVQRAGYQVKNPANTAQILMNRVLVQEEISRRLAQRRHNNELTVHRIQQEIANIAFIDVSRFYDAEGKLIPLDKLDEQSRKAIVEVTQRVVKTGGTRNGRQKQVVHSNYRIGDKLQALTILARSFGMLQDNLNVKNKSDVKGMTDDELDKTIADLVSQAGAGGSTH